MTVGMVVLIGAGVIILLQCILIWLGWNLSTDLQVFKRKVIKILREHDASLYPQKSKPKGKVIPYVGPIKTNR